MPETKNVSGEYKLRVNGTTCLHVTPDGINGALGATTPAAITGTTVMANTEFRGTVLTSNSTSAVQIKTSGGTQLEVNHVANAVEFVRISGATANGPPTISAQGAGSSLNLALTPKGSGIVISSAAARFLIGTAIPPGGTAGAGLQLSATSNFGVFFGSGAPSLAAAQGSLYLRSDGSSTSTRLYVNTDGSTTWTNVTTAA